MPYLILQDYYSVIQSSNLTQILNSDDNFRLTEQATAKEIIESYITQKYDISDEFRETVKFDTTTTYKAKDLVYVDATAYSTSSTYTLKALTLYQGDVYYCSIAITTPEAFNAAKWTKIGKQYALFYVTTPKPEFNIYANYKIGDEVFYKDKTYTCVIPSVTQSHQSDLEHFSTYQIPTVNYFPDDGASGARQWGTGKAYSVTPGTMPTDTNKWTAGDNRSRVLVRISVVITLYLLSARISPNNVPDIWVKNYDDAINWLKKCAKGEVNLNAPMRQPRQGSSIRMGSQVKRRNDY